MKTTNRQIALVIAFLLTVQGIVPGAVPFANNRSPETDENVFSLPSGKVGEKYEFQFQTEGGAAPLTWRISEGDGPPGLKLDPSGKLHGIPTVSQREAYRFEVEVSDSSQPPQKAALLVSLLIQSASPRILTSQAKLKFVTASPASSSGPAPATPVSHPPRSTAQDHPTDLCKNPPPDSHPFTLTVHAKVKGTGYPVNQAHVQILQLVPNSDPPEYQVIETGVCCSDEKCNTGFYKPAEIKLYGVTGQIKIAVQKPFYYPHVLTDVITIAPDESRVVTVELTPRDDEYYRAILGFEQTGVSAGGSQQNIFADLFTSRPLLSGPTYTECTKRQNDKYGDECRPPRQRIWGDIRITSVPEQKQNLFQALNGSLSTTAVNGAIEHADLDTGFAFLAGYQIKLTRGTIAGNRFDFSLILGGGASGVISPDKNVQIYKIPDSSDAQRRAQLKAKLLELKLDPAVIDGTQYQNIAFVLKDRDSFYRNYFGGLRFETHYGDTAPVRPSGQFDLTVGQDEAITGGRMRGAVIRLDGFFPLPIGKGNLVYLFGTAQLGLKRTNIKDPLLLPLADQNQTLTGEHTWIVPVPAASRDTYRIGVGVNLLQVFTGKPNN